VRDCMRGCEIAKQDMFLESSSSDSAGSIVLYLPQLGRTNQFSLLAALQMKSSREVPKACELPVMKHSFYLCPP
jgi:hypothetical protein